MQQHIHVTHQHPLGFGLKSVGLGLALSLVFLVSCDFNGQKVPRYNTVLGEKRLPQKNSNFIGGAPAQQAVPAPDQTFIQVEPQSYPAVQPVPQAQPVQPAFEPDPRPVGFRDEDRFSAAPPPASDPYNNPAYQHQPGVWDRTVSAVGLGPDLPPPPVQAAPQQRVVPQAQPVQQVQQDPFAGLPPLPTPPDNFPRLQEVPEVPQTLASRGTQMGATSASLMQELEQERRLSQQAQQMFSGEAALPQNYFAGAAQQNGRVMPEGNQLFVKADMPAPMAKPVPLPAPNTFASIDSPAVPMVKDEIVFETTPEPAMQLPPPPVQFSTSAPMPAPAPAPVERIVQPQPVVQAQAPLAPIQLRRPATSQAAPIRLQAPANPYGTEETLRSSRYVSRYATRRLQTTGSVY